MGEINWNSQCLLALKRELLKEEISDEFKEIYDRLFAVWANIAIIIKFDPARNAATDYAANEDAVNSLATHFPVADKDSPLNLFADADTAIDFFQDMRIITVLYILRIFNDSIEKCAPIVQMLCNICNEYVEKIDLQGKAILPLAENMIFCLNKAIRQNELDYEILHDFIASANLIAVHEYRLTNGISNIFRVCKIKSTKGVPAKERKAIFEDFEKKYNECIKEEKNKDLKRTEFVKYYYNKNEKRLKKFWSSPESLYTSFTKRKQNPEKNKKRAQKRKKDNIFNSLGPLLPTFNKFLASTDDATTHSNRDD